MIRYLINSSALWRVLRSDDLRTAWADVISASAGTCHPQRVEFRRSARNLDDYEQMNDMFAVVYPDVPVPKQAWGWMEQAQYRLLRHGAHRSLSTADLLLCATAAHHGLVILHDDQDFMTAAGCLADIRERRVHDVPG